jgi:integrase
MGTTDDPCGRVVASRGLCAMHAARRRAGWAEELMGRPAGFRRVDRRQEAKLVDLCELRAGLAEFVRQDLAPSTQHTYRRCLVAFDAWVQTLGPVDLGEPELLLAYLVQRFEDGNAPGTLELIAAAVRWRCRAQDRDDPVTPAVRGVIAGAGRERGTRQRPIAGDIEPGDLGRIVLAGRDTLARFPADLARFEALVLTLAHLGRRFESAVALKRSDAVRTGDGWQLTFRKSKTSHRCGAPGPAWLVPAASAPVCPVRAMDAWTAELDAAAAALPDDDDPWLFCASGRRRSSQALDPLRQLPFPTAASHLRRALEAAGIGTHGQFHLFRRLYVRAGIDAGVHPVKLMDSTDIHKLRTLGRYAAHDLRDRAEAPGGRPQTAASQHILRKGQQ